MEIFRAFTFDAAHKLTKVPPSHKCSNLHGHTFKVELHLKGSMDENYDWIIDFGEIKEKFKPLLERLDHHYLNEIPGLENPTSENIARWIWKHFKKDLESLERIVVYESPNSAASYEGVE